MEPPGLINNITPADYPAKRQMGATMEKQAVGGLKIYLRTQDAPVGRANGKQYWRSFIDYGRFKPAIGQSN